MGRAQRIVPDRTRRLVEHRDGACRVPGCENTRGLHVHHIVHWEDGGPTDTPNLCCLCRKHHRLLHKGHLSLIGNADDPHGLEFRDWRGRLLDSVGTPRPPGQPPEQGPTVLPAPLIG